MDPRVDGSLSADIMETIYQFNPMLNSGEDHSNQLELPDIVLVRPPMLYDSKQHRNT